MAGPLPIQRTNLLKSAHTLVLLRICIANSVTRRKIEENHSKGHLLYLSRSHNVAARSQPIAIDANASRLVLCLDSSGSVPSVIPYYIERWPISSRVIDMAGEVLGARQRSMCGYRDIATETLPSGHYLLAFTRQHQQNQSRNRN
ncbi:unnamed protein product, partial [Iphiclides podalirius]